MAGERSAVEKAGTPHGSKDRTQLKLLIFTAGNPSEGQQ